MNLYVDIIHGNNANNGQSLATAVKDLSVAVTLSATGDTIFVNQGKYIFSSTLTITKTLTFKGIGKVEFFPATTDFILLSLAGYQTVSCYNLDFFISPFNGGGSSSFYQCLFHTSFAMNNIQYVSFFNCIFLADMNISTQLKLTNCLFFKKAYFSSLQSSINNIFKDEFKHTCQYSDFNVIRSKIIYNNVTYNTLADFKTAFPTLELHSFNQDELLNPDYTLSPLSPAIGNGQPNGSTRTNIGAFDAAVFNSLLSLFSNGIANNVQLDANYNLQAINPLLPASFETDVMFFATGKLFRTTQLNTSNVFYITIHYRHSLYPFDKTSQESPNLSTWIETFFNTDLQLTNKYIQFRFTWTLIQ